MKSTARATVLLWAMPALVLAIILAQQLAWLNLHTAVDTWDDDAGLFKLALCFAGMDASGNVGCAAGAPYPPLVPWLTGQTFKAAGGASLHAALVSHWPFLVVLCSALFLGFRRIATPMAGLAAMAWGPVVVWSLHIRGKVYTEVPLAALVVAAVVALALSEGFRRRIPSVLLGVVLGLGLLTKWSFAFFMGIPAALAVVLAVRRSIGSVRLGWVAAVAAALVPAFVLAGAAQWIPFGLTIGFWLGVVLALALGVIAWRSPGDVDRAGLVNVGLCVVAVTAVAGPWYWSHLASMQEFLAANMAQKYHGDPVSGLAAWPFYPSVLTTRVMSTPLLLCVLTGLVLACRKGTPSLVRWSALTLVCGTTILSLLPYRSGRYVIAGIGLLAILGLWPWFARARMVKWAAPVALALGLMHQLSWIPFAAGGGSLPHHWAVFTLPAPDLMGNTRHGIYAAYQDLLRPRWRFLPVPNPPVLGQSEAEWTGSAIADISGGRPSFSVVVGGSQLNLNAASSHLAAHIPAPTSTIIAAQGALTASNLQAWRQRALRPRDQPATAHGRPMPRRLLVVLTGPYGLEPDGGQVSLLKAAGLVPLRHTGRSSGFEPVAISIWGEDSE